MASDTYARDGRVQFTAGGVMITASSILAALLVIAGLVYATGTSARHKAALAAAGCEPNLSPSGLQCTTYQVLTSKYMAIMAPASQQLTTDVAAYNAYAGDNLAAAESALTAEVASEHALDTSLAAFPFPPAVAPVAKALIQAIQARADLTAEQARSSSLIQLRSFDHRVAAAGTVVQTEMKLVRSAVDTPPSAN